MAETAYRDEVVSWEDDRLILVDGEDREIGSDTKAVVHDGAGMLHRAFSLFVFDDEGRLLMQQRSAQKRLWPLYWSNSCCSHPRHGEAMDEATVRRLEQELGLHSELEFLFKFRYHAQFDEAGAEHELCWVYAGRARGEVKVNRNEVAAWRWISGADLDREMAERPGDFTPWFRMEWERICRDHVETLNALTARR